MIELPEAVVIARQVTDTLQGKRIVTAIANQSPHKFAWYAGDPANYNNLLAGKTIGTAAAYAGNMEIQADGMTLLISTPLRYHAQGEKLPPRHQLLLHFADSTALTATVQMWGCIMCFREGEKVEFEGYGHGKELPSPLCDRFDRAYFDTLFNEETPKLSAKAFLATGQRIPGLGNGVLQDILWTARIHPKRKMAELSAAETEAMFQAVKSVLRAMTEQGGRDTERDLLWQPGGYRTILSKNTVGIPCPSCGAVIRKEPYLGGSIYYCPGCQAV